MCLIVLDLQALPVLSASKIHLDFVSADVPFLLPATGTPDNLSPMVNWTDVEQPCLESLMMPLMAEHAPANELVSLHDDHLVPPHLRHRHHFRKPRCLARCDHQPYHFWGQI